MRIFYRRRVRRKPTKHYMQHKEVARAFVHERVAYFAQTHGFEYKRIAIRNTRRSWGSCSELGNLNFSYKIIFLPIHLAEYIIVHELCHLRHLNHSKEFWVEVENIIPNCKQHQKELNAVTNALLLKQKPLVL